MLCYSWAIIIGQLLIIHEPWKLSPTTAMHCTTEVSLVIGWESMKQQLMTSALPFSKIPQTRISTTTVGSLCVNRSGNFPSAHSHCLPCRGWVWLFPAPGRLLERHWCWVRASLKRPLPTTQGPSNFSPAIAEHTIIGHSAMTGYETITLPLKITRRLCRCLPPPLIPTAAQN